VGPFLRRADLWLGVVAKLVLDAPALRGDLGPIAPRAASLLSPDRPSRFATEPPDVLDYGSDFTPPRAHTELFLVGHGRARAPTQRHALRVQLRSHEGKVLGEASRWLQVPVATQELPITTLAQGALGEPLAPRRVPEPPPEELWQLGERGGLPPVAGPDLRLRRGALRDDAVLVVEGARPEGPIELRLPGLRPLVEVDLYDGESDVACPLETVWIDLDAGALALVFRGEVPLPRQTVASVHRVMASLEQRGIERTRPHRHADTQRGDVGWAQVATGGGAVIPADPEDPRIDAAVVETWGTPAPEPRIPIDRFARVGAELAEDPRAKPTVLDANGFTERTWMIEERAWLERIAKRSLSSGPELAARYGHLFALEQDRLGTAEEKAISLEDYAAVRAALEAAVDPSEVLEQVGWALPRYARVERRWLAEAERDPAVAARLARRLAELAAREGGGG
jgi:hypothetical protein